MIASILRPLRSRAPAFLLTAFLLSGPSETAGQELDDERARVDSLVADFSGPDTPGVLVAVVREGAVAFEAAYGMANLSHAVPYTVQTRTNIGSTSKQFTAFAVALLAERGELSLDDDVRAHIPELPDLGETVTLRHLITHTSGYREFLNALAIGGWRLADHDHIDRSEILEVVRRQPELQNSPGAEWNYNNTGYALLAEVVERVAGSPFPEWMRENVFEPLGMSSTLVRADPGQVVPNSAQGYRPDDDLEFREARDLGSAVGAGAIYTTIGDLAIWMRNLRTGELGGPELMERMVTPYVLTTGDTTSYAKGLIVSRSRGLKVVQHGGADSAHRSTFIYYPELDAGLIVQSNHGGFDGSIPGRIAEVFFGEHMEPREEEVASEPTEFDPELYDPESFDIYVGRYELEAQPGFVLSFRREGDRLVTQATGQPELDLVPTSDSTFSVSGIQASGAFRQDERGRVTGLTLHQNGEHWAPRLDDADEESLDLSPFPGRYYSEEFETHYTIRLEDGHLVAHHRRLGPITLNHVKDDEFRGPLPLVTVEFERDDQGAVTAFRASNVRARGIRFERVR
jgi:CubicO group peptidase (beta-lactamase class C family)